MITQESKGLVLVADDSPEALAMMNEALALEGYTVLVAMDGKQAVTIAERMPPDIILMDIRMPNMDGIEACMTLKENDELLDIPVIFMTGLSDQAYLFQGLDAGAVDYIQKPINLDELLARVKSHLKHSHSTRVAHNALNEIGQLTFTCDANANIIWSTNTARELLLNTGVNTQDDTEIISKQIRYWLSNSPEKYSTLNLKGLPTPLLVNFLGRISPGEFLLRFVENDETTIRRALCERFNLTDREGEVLFWLSQGKTNREIGQILSVSHRTVNKHLEPIYRKLSVDNRTSATAVCMGYLNSR